MGPHFTLDAEFTYTMPGEGGLDIAAFFDDVAEHLATLGAEDISILLDESDQLFGVSLLVASQEFESIETVVGKGMGMIRTALHVCNVRTPKWPTAQEALLRGVRVAPATLIGQTEESESRMLASV